MNLAAGDPSAPGPSRQSADHSEGRRHRHGTHTLLLAWCGWLTGSWAVTLAQASAKLASDLLMPFAALVGLTLLWPMLRLSEGGAAPELAAPGGPDPRQCRLGTGPSPVRILREWLSLNLVLQAVLWPLMLNAQWTAVQTACLDGLMLAWSLLAALLVAWGVRTALAAGRTLAMVACLALLLGEPALMGVLNRLAGPSQGLTWRMHVSPIELMRHLTGPQLSRAEARHWAGQVMVVGTAAVVGWVGLLACQRAQPR